MTRYCDCGEAEDEVLSCDSCGRSRCEACATKAELYDQTCRECALEPATTPTVELSYAKPEAMPTSQVVPVQRYMATCDHDGCEWKQEHLHWESALFDVQEHDRNWHDAHGAMAAAEALKVEPKVKRVLDAARKIENGPLAGRLPSHLGGCIGPLSDTKCQCGLSDLRFAIRALDVKADQPLVEWP